MGNSIDLIYYGKLDESQATGMIKNCVSAIEKAKAQIDGFLTKKDTKNAIARVEELKKALLNTVQSLQPYVNGLIQGDKSVGGGIAKDALNNFMKNAKQNIENLCKQKVESIQNPQAQGDGQNNQQASNQQQNGQSQQNSNGGQNGNTPQANGQQSAINPEVAKQEITKVIDDADPQTLAYLYTIVTNLGRK